MPNIWAEPIAPFVLILVFIATIALTTYVDRQPIGKYFPSVLLVLIVPGALANLDLIPSQAPIFGQIAYLAVPMGVALLLLRADLKEIIFSSGIMLPVFILASVASIISILLVGQLIHIQQSETASAAMTALFIGSVINVVATAQALQMDDTLLAAVLAANAIIAPFYLAVIFLLMGSKIPGRLMGKQAGSSRGEVAVDRHKPAEEIAPDFHRPLGTLVAVSYAIGLFILVEIGCAWAGLQNYSIMIVTVFAIAIPNLFKGIKRYVDGDREIGMMAMYMFVSVTAVQVNLADLGTQGLLVIGFIVAGLALHLLFLIPIGRLFKADPHIVLLASLAGYGGPTSTAAVAAMQKREDLVTPGILCALFGVIIGNFVGVLSYQLFAALL